jgi:glycosyltransferase involved in cell wall biosynthesis
MTLGVVIIGRNEGERLLRCLLSVACDGRRLVYVDSGSTDGSVAAAQAVGAEVVNLDNRNGFTAARARNVGFRHLTALAPETEWVQFVDGDCEVQPSWWGAAQTLLRSRPDVVAVCGRRRERHP